MDNTVTSFRRRWLVPTIIALLLAAGTGMFFSARYLLWRHAMSIRQAGMAAAAIGDHENAANLLARYISRYPDDVEALSCYVLHREQAELPNYAHLADTISGLKMLLEADPSRVDDRRHLLELYLRFDMRSEALDTANAILSRLPRDVRTLELKTELLMRARQHQDALAVAEQWVAVAPLDVQAHMARMSLRNRLNHPAERIIADALALQQQHPDDPRFELLAGFAYAQAGNTEQAAQWLRRAAKRPSPDDKFTQILISQLDSLGMREESLTVLQDLAHSGAGREVRHSLAKRLWEIGRWAQVAELLKDLDPTDPRADASLLAFNAIALANLKQAERSAACREALARRDQPVSLAWAALLNRLIDGTAVEDRPLIAACKAGLAHEPYNVYLRYFLGDAEARLGESEMAIEAWERISEENLTWSTPLVRLSELLLARGQIQPALEAAAAAARRDPNNGAAVVALARAWADNADASRTEQPEQLLQLVSQIQQDLPGEQRTLGVQIQLLAKAGKKDQAVALARSALAKEPPADEQFMIDLAGLSQSLGLGIEDECFARSEQAHGLSAVLAYARAVQCFANDRAADGLVLLDQAAAKVRQSGSSNNDPAARLWQLARARYLDLIEDGSAKAAFAALADAYPADLPIQQATLAAHCIQGDADLLQRTIDRLKGITGEESLSWKLAQARLFLRDGRSEAERDRAAVMLSSIVQAYPNLPEPRTLLAKALVGMGRTDQAIEHLSVAARLDPSSTTAALQLAALLQTRGDFERASQQLDRVAPQLRDSRQMRQAALLLAAQGRNGQAVQLLEQEKESREGPQAASAQSDLLLARLYHQQHQDEKAEAIVRKLLENNDLSAIQFAVSLYASQGRQAEARQVLSRLDQFKLEPGLKAMAQASYYAQIGDLRQAISLFELATREASDNSAAWRNLATCRLAAGTASEALATVERGLGAIPSDKALAAIRDHADVLTSAAADPNLRNLAVAYTRDPLNSDLELELLTTISDAQRGGRPELLVSRLKQFVERRPTFLPAQLQLAACYARLGRVDEAVAALDKAASAFPTDPEPLRLLAGLCLDSARWQPALAAAKSWKSRVAGNGIAADLLIARAQMGLKQPKAAIEQLKPHLAAAQSDPERHVELLMRYAAALAASGQAQQAADLLMPLAEKSAQFRTCCIQVAIDALDSTLAGAWLSRIEAMIPPAATGERVAIAEACDRIGRQHRDSRLIEKASGILATLSSASDAPASALLAAAMQSERCGKASDAEALYRRALQTDPNLATAANNLAMLITARKGDLKEAAQLAATAAKLQPDKAGIQDTLAFVQSAGGDATSAAASMRRAVQLDPANPRWRVQLARYLLDCGQAREAAAAINDVERSRSDSQLLPPDVSRQLDAIRRQIGQSNRRLPA